MPRLARVLLIVLGVMVMLKIVHKERLIANKTKSIIVLDFWYRCSDMERKICRLLFWLGLTRHGQPQPNLPRLACGIFVCQVVMTTLKIFGNERLIDG